MSNASRAYEFCSTFEAELLLELMLRQWRHPFADDADFRNDLLERTTEVLKSAKEGQQVIEELPAAQTNFVGAAWYVESVGASTSGADVSVSDQTARAEWLTNLRRSIPSCFCPLEELG